MKQKLIVIEGMKDSYWQDFVEECCVIDRTQTGNTIGNYRANFPRADI